MLKKLLKYELKYTYKGLIIFYSLSLLFGVLTRIFFSFDNSFILNIIAQVCSGVTISMIANIIINNLIRLWIRFKQNLYGDESYLTHTLPVEKKEIYLSKVVTGVVSLFTSILVIGLTLFIAYYSKGNIEVLKNILLPIAKAYNSTMIKFLLLLLIVIFLEFVSILEAGHTGIILGHRMINGKVGYSVLFGVIIYGVFQMFNILVLFLVSLLNKDMMNLFITNEIINIDVVKIIVYIGMVIYTLNIIIYYLINIKLFEKGVNVD